ncbi:amidohydrolase family protein [Elizabethkingia bruuniana]|uniref:Amidohydrolase family protein n=1 Tax=Elizabethkingia bruuniana TaxID=1756149 RepID=A0A7T7UYG7_9FLAO|nr:amidohydrolase family protein [Elizabethkingia bruuniana]KGO11398.1 amidohydrolase [Elizabethkingia miricola]AQX84991.1 amidohydrolase [Elizabethkingia bruuniana]KUY28824.1 amidohydrolase [Elizabethkingia bruuniana]OPB70454.1 amidohydrolase [Elizabethkingia bruuniana]QDZ62568.1 amidohydrolase [Elizabethkingia bruuniana]
MKKLLSIFFAAGLCSVSLYSQTFIKNVTIVDVVNKKLIPAQTVAINKEVIADVQKAGKKTFPSNAIIIDGTGKYLMPGMTDAHVHFFQSGGLYTRPDALDLRKYVPYNKEIEMGHQNMEALLKRYLMAGITSVIDVGATYNFLKLRDSLSGNRLLPSVYMTGPLLTTYEPQVFMGLKNDEPFRLVSTIEDAKKAINEQLPYRPDFIKIWYIVSLGKEGVEAAARKYEPLIKEVIQEAHKNKLKVAVHATERIAAQIAVQNGCDFLVHNIEDEVVSDSFVQILKSGKVILSPTLTVMDNYYNTFGQKIDYDTYDLKSSDPVAIGSIYDIKHLSNAVIPVLKQRFDQPQMKARISRTDSIRKVNLKKLADGGVTIAAGTDAGNIGTQHASSFQNELKAMQESGLSIWQVLQSAIINPVKILDKEMVSGNIAKGKIADMILLNADPTKSLENLTTVNKIFKNGNVLDPESLIPITPELLVQQQLNAYNARNIEAFLEPYSDDVEIYTFPNTLISKGKDEMRKSYTQMFAKMPNLHCELKGRIIQGNIVIDRESVSGMISNTKVEATAVYEIKNHKILKVYFIR